MKRFCREKFAVYKRRHKYIDGWIHPFTAWFMFELTYDQSTLGLGGAIAEIGVHQGKSFLPMYLGTEKNEHAVAIDVFEQQQYNKDGSGKGDRTRFLDNLKAITGGDEGVRIISRPSESVTPDEVLQSGPVRIFSVDGSHTEEATFADLNLAAATIAPGGAIFLDDLFQPAWPEVLGGTSRFVAKTPAVVPVFVVPGKVMFCDRQFVEIYHEWVKSRFKDWIDFEKKLFGKEVLGLGIAGNFTRRRFRYTPMGNKIAFWKKKLSGLAL
jgi:hypothetical protein